MKSEVGSPKCEIETLVCFALKEEAAPFRKIASGTKNLFILLTGIGRSNAENSVREFLKAHSPQCVLTCGFAGGLNPALSPGAVIFSTNEERLREQLLSAKAQEANFFCESRIATKGSEKRVLRERTGADAVEMESEVIQSICRERRIPCATVRVISDAAHEDLPLDFNRLSRPDMNLDYGKLVWGIAKSPKTIGALLNLQKRCQFAAERLADVLVKIILP